MGTIIVKDAVKREPGFLYYIDGQGNLCKAKMKTGGTKKKAAKKSAKKSTKKSKK
jgi:hypothetical protein